MLRLKMSFLKFLIACILYFVFCFHKRHSRIFETGGSKVRQTHV